AGAAPLVAHAWVVEIDEDRAFRLPVGAMADVALHLHHRARVVDDAVALAERGAEHRILPVLHRAVRRVDVDGPALSAVARGAAELLDRVRPENLLRMRPERLLRRFEAGPLHRLVAGRAAVGPAQVRH